MIRKSDVLHTAIFAGCVALGILAAQYYYGNAPTTDTAYQLMEPTAQMASQHRFPMRGFVGIGVGVAGWVVLVLLYLTTLRVIDMVLARRRPPEPAEGEPEALEDADEDDNSFTIEDGKDD